MDLRERIESYFKCLDDSLDALSLHKEGELVGLPSWVHCTRIITIGHTADGEGIVIKVLPDNTLEKDIINAVQVNTVDDINKIITPMSYGGGPLNKLTEGFFLMIGDMVVQSSNNQLKVPTFQDRGMVGWGRKKGYENSFNNEKAKEDAINFWNQRFAKDQVPVSYVTEVKKIIDKLRAIIKRKAFLERRIHRFINEHRDFLLPSYKRCLYEHVLYRGAEFRKADFILEREEGLPPILIELESPVYKVLTKKFDLSAEANHAKQQISEWVAFIDSDGVRNASGEYSFLAGPKERLIIIGRGLEHKDRLIDTKFDGVTFWTYDMFIEEIRQRLNAQYRVQCKIVRLEPKTPF